VEKVVASVVRLVPDVHLKPIEVEAEAFLPRRGSRYAECRNAMVPERPRIRLTLHQDHLPRPLDIFEIGKAIKGSLISPPPNETRGAI
jgi:hypothetical protein